ncbi:MAG: guanylate kinase [Oscillospiraceae bacterium]|nr:guanylate kinase [Oscillospiraceae bacterium]MBR0393075.1 guanylate kinase [Oscillospiraceae bacterium]
MDRQGKLIILSGPSGSGKSTVVFRMLSERNDCCFSISATTRSAREGEVDGREYFFVTRERFLQMIRDDELLEHAQYVSNYYGTPRAFVEEKLQNGMNVILDIEIQGARQVFQKVPDAVTVFMLPPSLTELRERLVLRGTETADAIEARLTRARQEIAEADFYRYMIFNDDVARAAKELSSIIDAEHCRFNSSGIQMILES